MPETIGINIENSQYLWRAVSQEVNTVLKELLEKNQGSAEFNLGLYARKWVVFALNTSKPKDEFKCTSNSDNKIWQGAPAHLSKTMNNLLAIQDCFNPDHWPKAVSQATKALDYVHQQQKCIIESYKQLGYEGHLFCLTMRSPLVHGLGETHPMEKFLTFDRNTGVPYIPSTSVKGVLKTRLMIQELNEDAWSLDTEEERLSAKEKGFLLGNEKDGWIVNENYPLFKELFGGLEEKGDDASQAQRGKIIFLDAFPKTFPRLKKEIMTPHYGDYYKDKGTKVGPTESQQPVPNAYLSVDPQNGEQKWNFVLLIHPDLSREHPDYVEKFMQIFENKDVLDIGFGSKTAIGYGQFASFPIKEWLEEKQTQLEEEKQKVERLAEQQRLEKEQQEEKLRRQEEEVHRREALGWSGRYFEDWVDGKSNYEAVIKFMESESLLPSGESLEAPESQIRQEKRELGQRILVHWEEVWGPSPEHWQKSHLQKLRKLLGISQSQKSVEKTWSQNQGELRQQLSNEEFLQTLDKDQLNALIKDAVDLLDRKEAKKTKQRIKKILKKK